LLAENINTNIDRRYILKNIWGDDSMYNSRNLDVYIRKIRKILEEDVNIDLITLRGFGYHLVVKE
jgi:DNA-binding response OmpR family regulator